MGIGRANVRTPIKAQHDPTESQKEFVKDSLTVLKTKLKVTVNPDK